MPVWLNRVNVIQSIMFKVRASCAARAAKPCMSITTSSVILYHPASYYTSHPSLDFVFEHCCHFCYPNPPQENMAPQQRHPGRTPRSLKQSSLISSGNSPLTSIQSSRSRHRHSASARHSPLSGSTTRDREIPLRLPRFQQHSFYRCSEKHLTGSPLLETPDNSDFDVRGSAQLMDDETIHQFRRCHLEHFLILKCMGLHMVWKTRLATRSEDACSPKLML